MLKIKEYEHDKFARGELSEDEIKEISSVLANLNKGDIVYIEFYRDGHMLNLKGNTKLDFIKQWAVQIYQDLVANILFKP